MKTVLDIPITKMFDLYQDGCKSTFVRIDSSLKENNRKNAHCVDSNNPTYYRTKDYFIQLDIEVIPVEK